MRILSVRFFNKLNMACVDLRELAGDGKLAPLFAVHWRGD